MSKLTAKFKPVGKFFSKVKSALKSVSTGLSKSKAWQVRVGWNWLAWSPCIMMIVDDIISLSSVRRLCSLIKLQLVFCNTGTEEIRI